MLACKQAHVVAPLHQIPSRRIAFLFATRARDSKVGLAMFALVVGKSITFLDVHFLISFIHFY